MLFHMIYVSTAIMPMSGDDLVDLLLQCRTLNDRRRITGMLLYKNSHFMQVIEGEEARVTETFRKIEKDTRHKSVDVLRAEYIQHREFPDWSMGFVNINNFDASSIPGYTRFLEMEFNSEYFSENSSEAHAMLCAFKDSSVE